MTFPIDQVAIGLFALLTAIVTGGFTIYNTRLSRKLSRLENKKEDNELLEAENNILEKLVPTLERKDEALDKIAEILDNVLNVQKLQNTRIDTLTTILKSRCQAPELIEAIRVFTEQRDGRGVQKDILKRLSDEYEDNENTSKN
jgi:hypothetical protein